MKKLLQHEPRIPGERETFLGIERIIGRDIPDRIDRVAGIEVMFTLTALGSTTDQVVTHGLGRIPASVGFTIRPLDGSTPFTVWEPHPTRRTATTVVVRSDSANDGDMVIVRLK